MSMDKRIKEQLAPLLMSMKFLGLYHDSGSNSINSPSKMPRTKFKWKFVGGSIYSFVLIIIFWANVARACVGLVPKDSGLTTRIIFLGWYIMCTLQTTILFVACRQESSLPEFFKLWNSLEDIRVTTNGWFSRRYVVLITIITWTLIVLNAGTVLYLFLGKVPAWKDFSVGYLRPFPETPIFMAMFVFVEIFQTGAWIFSITFIGILAYTVKLKFDAFTLELAKHVKESGDTIPSHLQFYRNRHLQLCDAVATLDGVMKNMVGLCLGFHIVVLCFVLYQVVNCSMDTLPLLIHIFWICMGVTTNLAISYTVSQVNEAAHSALGHVLKIQTIGATPEMIVQLQLFLTSLTGTRVGFTILNMIVVTKELIMTICGAFVTYFFLLFQFKLH